MLSNLLNHILEWVVFACALGQVALAGSLRVVVAISEHAAGYGLEVVGVFLLPTDCHSGIYIFINVEILLDGRKNIFRTCWQNLCGDKMSRDKTCGLHDKMYSPHSHGSATVFDSDSEVLVSAPPFQCS